MKNKNTFIILLENLSTRAKYYLRRDILERLRDKEDIAKALVKTAEQYPEICTFIQIESYDRSNWNLSPNARSGVHTSRIGTMLWNLDHTSEQYVAVIGGE